jgi:prolipoprotein diacylglyceryltransferase
MSIFRILANWLSGKPLLKTMTFFVIYIVLFCVVRFMVDANDFQNNTWKNIAVGLIIGLFTSIIIYSGEVKRKKRE